MRFLSIHRHWLAAGALALLAAGAPLSAAAETQPAVAPATARIVIQSTPVEAFEPREPSRTRFGRLEFRGGLQLSSTHKAFGGISGFHLAADGGRFLAVTDKGSWLRGRIVYRDGRPAGIADAEMAPMLADNGKPLAARGWYDTESLALSNGRYYVGIERVHKIVRFDVARFGLAARGEAVPVPADFAGLPSNRGLECLAAPQAGAPLAGSLIAIAERSLDGAGNHRGFVLKGGETVRFSLKRSEEFDVTDCTVLPPGDLLVLERRYSPARGVNMRLRRLALAAIKPGALVDGQALIEADLGFQIDNMEAVALHRNARGEAIITLLSDDNFSPIQRSLLLQFALMGE